MGDKVFPLECLGDLFDAVFLWMQDGNFHAVWHACRQYGIVGDVDIDRD